MSTSDDAYQPKVILKEGWAFIRGHKVKSKTSN